MDVSIQVTPARWPDDAEGVRGLLQQYFQSLACDPNVPASIREKDRLPELDGIAAMYGGSEAILLLARSGVVLHGCAAVRLLPSRRGAAELKRLFVQPGARSLGVGRSLALAAAAWARQHGAAELVLDTLPAAMAPAVRIYRSLGFEPMHRYNDNIGEEFAFFRLQL